MWFEFKVKCKCYKFIWTKTATSSDNFFLAMIIITFLKCHTLCSKCVWFHKHLTYCYPSLSKITGSHLIWRFSTLWLIHFLKRPVWWNHWFLRLIKHKKFACVLKKRRNCLIWRLRQVTVRQYTKYNSSQTSILTCRNKIYLVYVYLKKPCVTKKRRILCYTIFCIRWN